MNRTLAVNLGAALILSGCSLASSAAKKPEAPEVAGAKARVSVKIHAKRSQESEIKPGRKVGEFFVHRFSGAFRKAPLTLSEEVLRRDDDLWVVEYVLDDNEKTTRLRAWQDDTGAVRKVARVEDGHEIEASLAEYEAFMAPTSFAADENEGLVGKDARICLVGPSELDCETKNYRVRIGEQEAVLSVSQSDQLRGRDVAGEITTADGKLIYRSEIVEMGRRSNAKGVATR